VRERADGEVPVNPVEGDAVSERYVLEGESVPVIVPLYKYDDA
jgi:hypothetical protein